LARLAPNFRERLTQNNTEITALFRLLALLEQTAQIEGGFGLYRPEALVYLQTGIAVQTLSFRFAVASSGELLNRNRRDRISRAFLREPLFAEKLSPWRSSKIRTPDQVRLETGCRRVQV
jgi:hypothetical protein